MIDTMMVLWTRGVYQRFSLALLAFLLLFVSVSVLVFTITTSGIRWPEQVVSIPSPTSSPSLAANTVPAKQKAPLALAVFPTIPVIQQNPAHPRITHRSTRTPKPITTSETSNNIATSPLSTPLSSRSTSAASLSAPTPVPTSIPTSTAPTPITTPIPTPIPTSIPTHTTSPIASNPTRPITKARPSLPLPTKPLPTNLQPSLFPTIPYPVTPWSAFQAPLSPSTLSNSLNSSSNKMTLLKLPDILWPSLGISLLLLLLFAGFTKVIYARHKKSYQR